MQNLTNEKLLSYTKVENGSDKENIVLWWVFRWSIYTQQPIEGFILKAVQNYI